MKQTYNQAQLAEMAIERFQTLKVNKLYATTDGSFFLLENRARLHAGPKGNVFELKNDAAGGSIEEPISIKELKTRLGNSSDLQELTGMMLHEVSGANRKEAVHAIQVRIDEVTEGGKAGKTPQEERQAVLQELTQHGLDFDPDADTESLKTILNDFLAKPKSEATPLDVTGNVKTVVALVKSCEDKAVLHATMTAETAGANRTGVTKAIVDRLEELG